MKRALGPSPTLLTSFRSVTTQESSRFLLLSVALFKATSFLYDFLYLLSCLSNNSQLSALSLPEALPPFLPTNSSHFSSTLTPLTETVAQELSLGFAATCSVFFLPSATSLTAAVLSALPLTSPVLHASLFSILITTNFSSLPCVALFSLALCPPFGFWSSEFSVRPFFFRLRRFLATYSAVSVMFSGEMLFLVFACSRGTATKK